MLAVGAVDIFARAGEGAYNLYEKYLSTTAAAKQYQEEVQKTRNQEFGNTRSIEDTQLRIRTVTNDLGAMQDRINQINSKPWLFRPFMQQFEANQLSHEVVTRQKQLVDLQKSGAEQQHEQTLLAIQRDHSSAGLTGAAARQAELGRRIAENEENRKYQASIDAAPKNETSSSGGQKTEELQNQIARRQAAGEAGAAERAQIRETMQMQASAREAGLHGEAQLMAQRDAMLDQLKEKMVQTELSPIQYARQTAAVIQKYENERLERLRQQSIATRELQEQAEMASLKGVARTQFEGQTKINHQNDNLDVSPENRLKNIGAINRETAAQIADQNRQFGDEADRLTDQWSAKQSSGFARIAAERDRAMNDLQRRFDESFSGIDLTQPGAQGSYDQATGDLGRAHAAIRTGSDQQSADLARKNAEETSQIEAEARAKSLSAEKQQTAALQQEFFERQNKYNEMRKQTEISDGDYNRRAIAAAQQTNAQIEETARQSRQKMAGEFSGFFKSLDHPTQALAEMGSKVGGEVAAALVQRVQNHFGGAGGSGQGSTMDSLMHPQAIFDRIAGKLRGEVHPDTISGGAQSSVQGYPGMPSQTAPGANRTNLPAYSGGPAAGTQAISLGSAQISIGSASIAFAGGSGGGGTRSGDGSLSGGVDPDASFSGGGVSFRSIGSAGMPTGAGSGDGAPLSISGGTSSSGFGRGPGYSGGGGPLTISGGSGSSDFGMGTGTIGGAGSSSVAGPSTGSSERGSGAAGSTHNSFQSGLSDATGAYSLYQRASSIFGSSSGNVPSAPGVSGGSGESALQSGMNGTGQMVQGVSSMAGASAGTAAMLGGVASGAMGLYSAEQGNGGVGGTLNGAMSGIELGMAVGGPVGAAIGAVGGAVVGALGLGGREKARVYWLKQAQPRVQGDIDSFQQSGMDYMSAYQDIESAQADADRATNAMGPAAKSYFQDTIKPTIAQLEGKLTGEQRAGRADSPDSAAQYAVGSDSVPRDGLSIIHRNERIMPSDQNERITRAVESVGDSTRMAPASGFGGDVHLHVHAIDASGVQKFLNDNKHGIRSAVNASYAENSGGSDFYA
jgi:hypothetical protein